MRIAIVVIMMMCSYSLAAPDGTPEVIGMNVVGVTGAMSDEINGFHHLPWNDDYHGWVKNFDNGEYARELFVSEAGQGYLTNELGGSYLSWTGQFIASQYVIDSDSFSGPGIGTASVSVPEPVSGSALGFLSLMFLRRQRVI